METALLFSELRLDLHRILALLVSPNAIRHPFCLDTDPRDPCILVLDWTWVMSRFHGVKEGINIRYLDAGGMGLP